MTDQQHPATAHRFADPRLAELAATAASIDARLDGTNDDGGGGDQGGNDDQGGDHAGQGDDRNGDQGGNDARSSSSSSSDQGGSRDGDRTGDGQGDEGGQDWRARSREWERRSKANHEAAEAAKAEAKKASDTLEALRKALDPNGGEDDDPAKVAERTATERDEAKARADKAETDARTLRRERAAEKAARAAGADVDELLDRAGFLRKLGELDADATDDDVAKVVTDYVEANPKVKATPAGATTTPATTPPAGAGEQDAAASSTTGSDVDDALAARRKRRGEG